MPQIKPARPRDKELMERLKRLAAARSAQGTVVGDAECKRRARRKVTALPGLITFRTMRLQIPCTIADMSATGAKLQLPRSAERAYGSLEHLPERITLVMRADRLQVDCAIAWRRTNCLGVRYLGPPVPVPKG